jgi:hypothetical protein
MASVAAVIAIAVLPSGATTPVRAASRCASASGADATACGFYETFLELRPAGLPTKRQQRTLEPCLSKRLRTLLDEARKEQRDFAKRIPTRSRPSSMAVSWPACSRDRTVSSWCEPLRRRTEVRTWS